MTGTALVKYYFILQSEWSRVVLLLTICTSTSRSGGKSSPTRSFKLWPNSIPCLSPTLSNLFLAPHHSCTSNTTLCLPQETCWPAGRRPMKNTQANNSHHLDRWAGSRQKWIECPMALSFLAPSLHQRKPILRIKSPAKMTPLPTFLALPAIPSFLQMLRQTRHLREGPVFRAVSPRTFW